MSEEVQNATTDEAITPPNYVRSFVATEVKAVNDEEREVMHAISSDVTDRMGDVVVPQGAQVANYLKNPVVIADHDYSIDKIVGRAVDIHVSEKEITARTRFRDTELGRAAMALAKEGLGGWSIGFRPLAHEPIKDKKGVVRGFRFNEWELLEYSIVAIPCNQDIVNNAVKRGLLSESQVPTFFKVDPDHKPVEEPEEPPAPEAAAEQPNERPRIDPIALQVGVAGIEAAVRKLRNAEAAVLMSRSVQERK